MDITSSEISLGKSIIPIVLLITMLFYNIIFFENNDWLGDYTYHYILIFTSLVATVAAKLKNPPVNALPKQIISGAEFVC